MIDSAALATLSAVLHSGSFDRASARLGLTPSAVSQRIKALEDRLGAPLILRGTPCTATPLGARLLHHADTVAALETALLRDIGQPADARPVLRIAVTADSLATWLMPALAATGDVLFDLVIDDQDHSAEWLRRGEVAGALTARPGPVRGCDCVALGALRYHAVASPDWHARWLPAGLEPAALSRAPMLLFNAKDALQHQWMLRETGARLARRRIRSAPRTGFAMRRGRDWAGA